MSHINKKLKMEDDTIVIIDSDDETQNQDIDSKIPLMISQKGRDCIEIPDSDEDFEDPTKQPARLEDPIDLNSSNVSEIWFLKNLLKLTLLYCRRPCCTTTMQTTRCYQMNDQIQDGS